MKKFFMVFLFLLCAVLYAAESKIAVVDLEKVFREYYKSKIAEDTIRRQAGIYRDYMNKLANELKAAQETAENARADALNIGLSSAERAKAEKRASEAMRLVSEKRAAIELYRSGRTKDMQKLEADKRVEIMNDIKAELRKRAASGGYSYVFDCSGKTTNGQGALLIYPESHDITAEVISNLNRGATGKR
ncbi:MAG: OmpH family outer membrane protein [Lentisphaeria bacterium]|nr:OmpH family outer membrane protein [Lentisphaerota bacterium]MBR2633121.1 OmpH family outer membrane protein [Lentisphaeria bacterium]